jgi:hypothetical protein
MGGHNPMRRALLIVFLVSLAAHLSQVGVLWVDEAYGLAAGQNLLAGKTLYRDIWFDKPPIYAWVTLLWGAKTGVALRVAGALYTLLCAWLAGVAARRLFGAREAQAASLLTGFFLTFDSPGVVLPLAPDALAVGFALGWAALAAAGFPFWAGVVAGAALLANSKALLLLPLVLLWRRDAWRRAVAGWLAAIGAGAAVLSAQGALAGHWEQVWVWGYAYSRDTFLANPLAEGLKKTAGWLLFHAALAVPAAVYWWRERDGTARRMALWLLLGTAGVAAGWRFFPRYYFALLPVVLLAAARGWTHLRGRWATVLLAAALAIPAVRFTPAYARVARDTLQGRPQSWRDLSMFEDCRGAAAELRRLARPGDTLLVWGYRPELNVMAGLTAGTRFLDSQPLTGVLADRHLTRRDAIAAATKVENRRELIRCAPTFVVDGLGPYNPELAIARFPDLSQWLEGYRLVGSTAGTRIYRRRE